MLELKEPPVLMKEDSGSRRIYMRLLSYIPRSNGALTLAIAQTSSDYSTPDDRFLFGGMDISYQLQPLFPQITFKEHESQACYVGRSLGTASLDFFTDTTGTYSIIRTLSLEGSTSYLVPFRRTTDIPVRSFSMTDLEDMKRRLISSHSSDYPIDIGVRIAVDSTFSADLEQAVRHLAGHCRMAQELDRWIEENFAGDLAGYQPISSSIPKPLQGLTSLDELLRHEE